MVHKSDITKIWVQNTSTSKMFEFWRILLVVKINIEFTIDWIQYGGKRFYWWLEGEYFYFLSFKTAKAW